MDDSSSRLNKFLALQLGISRREADDLIRNQLVDIDGHIAELGSRVSPNNQIKVAGKPLSSAPKQFTYLIFNKPVNYVCSRRVQGDKPTIYSIIPSNYHELKPVGRLDANSSGLLIMTNDGDYAYQMTHPKFHKVKIYLVRLDRDLEPLHQQMISDFGINLDDGRSQLKLMRLSETNRLEWQVTMSEGRNRQIRRTFAALGYKVNRLHRTQFGPYGIDGLKSGEFVATDRR